MWNLGGNDVFKSPPKNIWVSINPSSSIQIMGFDVKIIVLLTQRSVLGLKTCSGEKVFWFSFLGKLIDFESERADWIESKLNLAGLFTEIESSVFLCLFCPPGVLQINPQLKRSVVTAAFSGTGTWWMRTNRNGLRLKASQRSRYRGWTIYSFAGDPVNDSACVPSSPRQADAVKRTHQQVREMYLFGNWKVLISVPPLIHGPDFNESNQENK